MGQYETYATAQDLADYLGKQIGELPEDVQRLINRASELVKQSTMDNLKKYITIPDNVVEALKLATCAQIEYWLEMGESTSIVGNVENYSSGGLSVKLANVDTGQLCKRSINFLNRQGLLFRGIRQSYRFGYGRQI
jgi:hypothetical protein